MDGVNQRIRFMQPNGRWGEWLSLKGAYSSGMGGTGGGSLSLQVFANGVANFPLQGVAQKLYIDTSTDPYTSYVWHEGAYKAVGGGSGAQDTFETVSKNQAAFDFTLAYEGGLLKTITYTNGVIKTLNYNANELLTSIVLSGATPSGIALIKTLEYDAQANLISVTYS